MVLIIECKETKEISFYVYFLDKGLSFKEWDYLRLGVVLKFLDGFKP